MAEYVAVIRALERAERRSHPRVVIEMDSMLVCCQLRGEWRFQAEPLKPLFRAAFGILCRIRNIGCQVWIRHIYREHNVEADSKANLGADGITAAHGW